MVPSSSVDSSGFVPMKSKLKHRTVNARACSPMIASWRGSAAEGGTKRELRQGARKRGENKALFDSDVSG